MDFATNWTCRPGHVGRWRADGAGLTIMDTSRLPVGVAGGGAWGTALAIAQARAGNHAVLWGRDVASLITDRENRRYLPGVVLEERITVVAHAEALRGCPVVLLAVPAQALRLALRGLLPHLSSDATLVLCAKGIERTTGKLLSEIVREEAGEMNLAVLSGPSFAAEVARGLPTAATIAAPENELAARLAVLLSGGGLRLYHSTDLVGVEIAGALKNVMAIACGVVVGRGLGENARASLMTRGLAEIGRLISRRGGRAETLLGLAGIGDMALTCGSAASRNFAFGLQIGGAPSRGLAPDGVVEGAATAEAALIMAEAAKIEMPICAAVHSILARGASIDDTVSALMNRPLKTEAD